MFSIYFDCLTLCLPASSKLVLMLFDTNALTYANSGGKIYIMCCSFEMEEKAI